MSNTQATSILSEVPPPATRRPFHEAIGSIRSAFMSRQPVGTKTASPFVSISKFVVANDKIAEVKDAFRYRPHLVDKQPGFVVFSPFDRPEEIWLVTYWTDAESFRLWHHSHLYQQSHKGVPKGLKLVPGETEIRAHLLISMSVSHRLRETARRVRQAFKSQPETVLLGRLFKLACGPLFP